MLDHVRVIYDSTLTEVHLAFTITWEFVTFTAAQEDRLGLFFREGRLFLVVVEGS